MRISVVGVGRLKDDAERHLVDRYLERLKGARTLGIGPVAEKEIAEARQPVAAERRAFEAQRLLQLCRDADVKVALDEGGRPLTSVELANWLARERDRGARHIAFVLGGPDGHGQELLAVANLKLSLSAMTFPHGLARALLLEQLYRATTILGGHPYHRA